MLNRLLIATTVDGNPKTARVTVGYHHAVRALERQGSVQLPFEWSYSDDLGRARSRIACNALERDGWDYLLWWDEDVYPTNMAIVGQMLATGKDVVAVPYPRKRIPTLYPYKPLDSDIARGGLSFDNGVCEVEYIAIGFCLTSRKCIQQMADAYREELWFSDGETMDREITGMFTPMFGPVYRLPDGRRARNLFSEDYTFMHRWRAIGGRVHMLATMDMPLTHVGGYCFTGAPGDIAQRL